MVAINMTNAANASQGRELFFTVGVLPIEQSLSLNVNFANRNPTAGKRNVVSFDPDYE